MFLAVKAVTTTVNMMIVKIVQIPTILKRMWKK